MVHFGHLHKLAWSHRRSYMLDVEGLGDTLIPLIKHGLKARYSSLTLLWCNPTGPVGVEEVVNFALNVSKFNTSSVVVKMNLAILRPYQSCAVYWRYGG
jgi:hypothetical protein